MNKYSKSGWYGLEKEGLIEISGENAVTQEEAIAEEVVRKIQDSTTLIYLTSDGDIYKQPREKYTAHISPTTGRYKLLRILTDKFITTSILSEILGGKSKQTIRSDVKFINRKAEKMISLDEDLIEGKRKSGYRINPKYSLLKE